LTEAAILRQSKGKKKGKKKDVEIIDEFTTMDSQRLLTLQQEYMDSLASAKVRRNML